MSGLDALDKRTRGGWGRSGDAPPRKIARVPPDDGASTADEPHTDEIAINDQPTSEPAQPVRSAARTRATRDPFRRLCDYREGRAGRPTTRSQFLFMNFRRSRITKEYEPMGTDGIYRMIKATAEEAGFDRQRVHPHLLRATAITRMCSSGMHPAMVSEITGVSVAVIARHYHHPAPEDVWQAAMRALDA